MSEALFTGLAKQQLGLILGIGVGSALAASLEPEIVAIRQSQFETNPSVAPDAAMLASGVAQGQVDEGEARAWARKHGIGNDAFTALVNIANTGPALGSAMQAYRRGDLTDEQFDTALLRASVEKEWWPALRKLKDSPLDPAQLATAIHRNIMHGPDLIIATAPTTPGKVLQVPQSQIDPVEQAAWSGYSAEKLRVLVGITGLPPGLMEMLRLLNMGEVTEPDVQRAVAQSNLRNEYMDVVLALRRQLLTPHEYEEAALRGIITEDEADAGAALHGMEKPDARLLFETLGRPLAVHQITTGLARGGEYGGSYDAVPEPYRDAIRRSNIRPEYARLAHANRYSIPSYFILRAILQDGGMTQAQFANYGKELGWPPDLAEKAAKAIGAGTGTHAKALTAAELLTEYAGDYIDRAALVKRLEGLGYPAVQAEQYAELGDARRIVASRDARLSRIRTRFVAFKLSEDDATKALAALDLPAAAHDRIWQDWLAERDVNETLLTQAQIVKAFKQGVWTRDVTLAALQERGMSAADAGTLLDEQ